MEIIGLSLLEISVTYNKHYEIQLIFFSAVSYEKNQCCTSKVKFFKESAVTAPQAIKYQANYIFCQEKYINHIKVIEFRSKRKLI